MRQGFAGRGGCEHRALWRRLDGAAERAPLAAARAAGGRDHSAWAGLIRRAPGVTTIAPDGRCLPILFSNGSYVPARLQQAA
jgi:hypothetical protein